MHECIVYSVLYSTFRNLLSPYTRLLVEFSRHETGHLLVTQSNLDHLLQARVEPDEAPAMRTGFSVHLKLELRVWWVDGEEGDEGDEGDEY